MQEGSYLRQEVTSQEAVRTRLKENSFAAARCLMLARFCQRAKDPVRQTGLSLIGLGFHWMYFGTAALRVCLVSVNTHRLAGVTRVHTGSCDLKRCLVEEELSR